MRSPSHSSVPQPENPKTRAFDVVITIRSSDTTTNSIDAPIAQPSPAEDAGQSSELQTPENGPKLSVRKLFEENFDTITLESDYTHGSLPIYYKRYAHPPKLDIPSNKFVFQGEIITNKGKMTSPTMARREVKRVAKDPNRWVYWVGTSVRSDGASGIGVAFRSSSFGWQPRGYRVEGHGGSELVNYLALLQALDNVESEIPKRSHAGDIPLILDIYSGSRKSLSEILRYRPWHTYVYSGLIKQIITMSYVLKSRGIQILFHWVPSHARLAGTHVAARVACAAAVYGQRAKKLTFEADEADCSQQLLTEQQAAKDEESTVDDLLSDI